MLFQHGTPRTMDHPMVRPMVLLMVYPTGNFVTPMEHVDTL